MTPSERLKEIENKGLDPNDDTEFNWLIERVKKLTEVLEGIKYFSIRAYKDGVIEERVDEALSEEK